MESTDLKSSNATTAKLSRASLVTAIDTWHRSVVFHASIVDMHAQCESHFRVPAQDPRPHAGAD